jgi:nicotinamidase-related amidase
MQRLFAEETAWHVAAIADILPNVIRLCEASRQNTIFARFIPPQHADHAIGQWQAYYRRWSMVTQAEMSPALHNLVAPLAGRPGRVIDKTTYSLFSVPGLAQDLRDEGIDTLVFSGAETDVCVYASVLAAVDHGFRVVIASDAVASADPVAHASVLSHLAPRLCEQIYLAATEEILAAWQA